MSQPHTITLSMPERDIAMLTFDMRGKGANILSRSVLDELAAHLDELEQRDDLDGLILCSAKPGTFIAGADLREFAAGIDMPREDVVKLCRLGQTLFGRLSKCPFITVAAINGVCVGGGAELALWCDRRVMSDNPRTEIGFPEVKLGLFPGWGGTVRAPRMIGLSNAVELITGGESIDADAAFALGLACDVVPPERLQEAAVNVVRHEQRTRDYARDRRRWAAPIEVNETELGFLGATASAYIQQQTKGHYPAPLAALELMLETAALDAEAACEKEAAGMSLLFGTPINKALLNVFFLSDRIKKDRGVSRDDIQPRDVKCVGVIGAGIMGAGIAAANVKRDVPVLISDSAESVVAQSIKSIWEEVSYDKKTKAADYSRAAERSPLLNISIVDSEMASCDLVIEAIVEKTEVKKAVFKRIEPLLSDNAILASNTSTIPITTLANDLKRPNRFCGIHFFNPVRRMQLVEVIRGEQTDDDTVATAVAYAKRIGKMPIVVKDGPGFLVNRLLFPYMNEALELICEGAEINDVERAATAFGMPMGPIALFDMVGIDTAFYAGRTMWEAFPDRIVASPLLCTLVKAGRLGQKTGAGFFSYKNRKKRAQPDPDLEPILAQYLRDQKKFTPEQLTARLFLPMLVEATRVLEEQVVRDPRDVDFGLVFGIGFPAFKGGLLHWADTLGTAAIVEMLKPLESLGERVRPTPLLLDMVRHLRKFYQ